MSKKEKNNHFRLFSLFKKSAPVTAEEDEPQQSSESEQIIQEEAAEVVKNALEVSGGSLIYSLWHEWKEAVDRQEESEGGQEETGESKEEPEENEEGEGNGESGAEPVLKPWKPEEKYAESLEVFLEISEEGMPLSDQELENERKRILDSLQSKVKKHPLFAKKKKENDDSEDEEEILSIDAEVIIYVTKNRMVAWAFILPPYGEGKALSRSMLDQALEEASVREGVDEGALKNIIEEQPYFRLVLIARGTPMVPGDDGYVIENFAQEREKSFALDDRGKMDYRAQNSIQGVREGEVLCQIFAPTPGSDGVNIQGDVIPAKAGKEAKVLTGRNTKIDEDKMQLVATIDGQLKYQEGRFNVEPRLDVSGDVNYDVGNIDFYGDVRITGDVREGFTVRSSGTVIVDGLVEAATIEAEGDVIIQNGIAGDERAVIRAGGSVKAAYMENCTVYAGKEVHANNIIGSDIFCDEKIVVKNGRGTIIGGTHVAGQKIEATTIGCRAERPTELIVGETPNIQKKKEELRETIEKTGKELEEMDRAIKYLAGASSSNAEKRQKMEEFLMHRRILIKQYEKAQKELEEMTQRGEGDVKGRIIADTVYPPTQVCIRDYTYIIQDEIGNANIHVEENEIVLH